MTLFYCPRVNGSEHAYFGEHELEIPLPEQPLERVRGLTADRLRGAILAPTQPGHSGGNGNGYSHPVRIPREAGRTPLEVLELIAQEQFLANSAR